MTDVEPSRDAEPSTEDRYRARTEFDEVGSGAPTASTATRGAASTACTCATARSCARRWPGASPGRGGDQPGHPRPLPAGVQQGRGVEQAARRRRPAPAPAAPSRRAGVGRAGSRSAGTRHSTPSPTALIDAIVARGPSSILREGTPEIAGSVGIERLLGLIGATTTDLNGADQRLRPRHPPDDGQVVPVGPTSLGLRLRAGAVLAHQPRLHVHDLLPLLRRGPVPRRRAGADQPRRQSQPHPRRLPPAGGAGHATPRSPSPCAR